MEFKISKRLLTVAALVPSCDTLADIGSDHGLLPLYLLQSGQIQQAYCCDIRPGPLNTAKKNIAACGMENLAHPLLGNGLEPMRTIPHHCVVIAGMGGETIADILTGDQIAADDPRWFVLQPMTRANLLRRYLAEAGFEIVRFAVCEDSGRLYECMAVKKGVVVETDPLFLEINRPLDADPALYHRYLLHEHAHLRTMLDGMQQSASPDSSAIARLASLLSSIEQLPEFHGD